MSDNPLDPFRATEVYQSDQITPIVQRDREEVLGDRPHEFTFSETTDTAKLAEDVVEALSHGVEVRVTIPPGSPSENPLLIGERITAEVAEAIAQGRLREYHLARLHFV